MNANTLRKMAESTLQDDLPFSASFNAPDLKAANLDSQRSGQRFIWGAMVISM